MKLFAAEPQREAIMTGSRRVAGPTANRFTERAAKIRGAVAWWILTWWILIGPVLLISCVGCGGRQTRQQIVDDFSDEARDLGLRIYGLEARIERLEEQRRSVPAMTRRSRESDGDSYDSESGSPSRPSRDPGLDIDDSLLTPPDIQDGPAGRGTSSSGDEYDMSDELDMGFETSPRPTRDRSRVSSSQRGSERQRSEMREQTAVGTRADGEPSANVSHPADRTYRDLARRGPQFEPGVEKGPPSQLVSRLVVADSSAAQDFDGRGGDDGMTLLVQAMDRDGQVLAVPCRMLIELQDESRQTVVARWEFTESEVEESFVADLQGVGYRLDVSWKTSPPPTRKLHAFVLLLASDGHRQAHFELTADLPGLTERGPAQQLSERADEGASALRSVMESPTQPPATPPGRASSGWVTREGGAGSAAFGTGPAAATRDAGETPPRTSGEPEPASGVRPNAARADTGPTAAVYGDGATRRADARSGELPWR